MSTLTDKNKYYLESMKVKVAEAMIRAQVTFFIRLVFIFFSLLIFKTVVFIQIIDYCITKTILK